MSAFVVSKVHIDLLVRAALHAAPAGDAFRWWAVDENGEFDVERGAHGWHEISELAESFDPEEQERRGLLSPSQVGQLLVNENVRSVGHRYSEPGRVYYYGAGAAARMDDLDPDAGELPGPCDAYYMGPYVYANPGYTLNPGEIFRAIDVLDYQSCEHDGWRSSEAFAFLAALRERTCSQVEGYASSPHGWEADDLAGKPLEFSRRIL